MTVVNQNRHHLVNVLPLFEQQVTKRSHLVGEVFDFLAGNPPFSSSQFMNRDPNSTENGNDSADSIDQADREHSV